MDNNKEPKIDFEIIDEEVKEEEVKVEKEKLYKKEKPKKEKQEDGCNTWGLVIVSGFVVLITIFGIAFSSGRMIRKEIRRLNNKITDVSNIQSALITKIHNANLEEMKDDIVELNQILTGLYERLGQYDFDEMKTTIDGLKDKTRQNIIEEIKMLENQLELKKQLYDSLERLDDSMVIPYPLLGDEVEEEEIIEWNLQGEEVEIIDDIDDIEDTIEWDEN